MCDRVILENGRMLMFVALRSKTCVIKLLMLIFLQYNSFLNAIRLKKCVIKLLILIILYLILFLLAIRLNKFDYVSDWFVKSKMIEKLDDALFANDDIIFINEDKNYYKVGKWLRVGKVGIRW